jgi:hypothetical protein
MFLRVKAKKFPVIYQGVKVELESAEAAAALLRALAKEAEQVETPPETVTAEHHEDDPEDEASEPVTTAWSAKLTKKFVESLWPKSRDALLKVAATPNGQMNSNDLARAMGMQDARGLGPVRRLWKKQADALGLPAPHELEWRAGVGSVIVLRRDTADELRQLRA